MGFWHTGYLEFHEPDQGTDLGSWTPSPPRYPCEVCGAEFSGEVDLRVHAFAGHPIEQPVLVLNGRECGRRRLTITYQTSAEAWVVRNADAAWINERQVSVSDALAYLAHQRNEVVDLRLANRQVTRDFQFEFALAEKEDLEGVDSALDHLIRSEDLSPYSIDAFIMRSKKYSTAERYYGALADYLYGLLEREADGEGRRSESEHRGAYEDRFDAAVNVLGTFDRPAAEAICGIVAFHYNQLGRAMTKTRSDRVAKVSMRIKAMLEGRTWDRGDLASSTHGSLDYALSDAAVADVLRCSAMAIDGSAPSVGVEELIALIDGQRAADEFKLRLIAAEHFLAVGDRLCAMTHADFVRYGDAERWYDDFRRRLERGA
ncbi:MAG: hypothetical protein ACKOI2_12935 [Actinomycetota bacterium]